MSAAWAALPAAFLVLLASIKDWREFRIPNSHTAGIAALAVAVAFFEGAPAPGWREALLSFVGGAALYACGFMGAGDVKLFSACALWLPGDLPALLFTTACAGGIVALFVLLKNRGSPISALRVPYGVAIGAGAIFTAAGSYVGV